MLSKIVGTGVVAVLALPLAAWAAPDPPHKLTKEHVTATLLADRTAVVPGEPLRLGVQFEIDDAWHIYWITPGEPDAPANPTVIEVTAPAGFGVSNAHFPPPRRHRDETTGDLYLLEGKPVVLFDVTPPKELAAKTADFSVKVSWLVCKESCLPGDGTLKLSLPVVASAGDAKPANEKLFARAAQALPRATAKAGYVKLSSRLTQDRVRPGDKFQAQLVVDIKAAHHIQSSTPPTDDMIATQVFVEPVKDMELTKPLYPKGVERTVKGLGKLSEYAGQVVIGIPLEAAETLKGERAEIRGVLQYQACNEKGTCYPPEDVQFSIAVPLAKKGEKITPAATPVAGGAAGENGKPAPAPPDKEGTRGSRSTMGDAADSVTMSTAAASGKPTPAVTAIEAPYAELTWIDRTQRWFQSFGLIGTLVLALMGGFVLNFMPCVLPVISLKVLSFVKQAQSLPTGGAFPIYDGPTPTMASASRAEHRGRIFALGLVFSAGIMTSFLILAMLALWAGNTWGSLFQYPQVVIGLAAIVTAFALSLFGVFTISPPHAVDELGAKVSGEGFGGAFAMGLLATLLGTACTAPFLSAVIAIAIRQPPAIGLGIFAMAGLGMSLPYIVLTAKPAWLRFVPKAGPWMKTFEQVMGFILLATVIWLVYPLPNQITGKGLVWALVFILFVAFGAWLYGRLQFGDSIRRRARYYSATLLCIAGGWLYCFHYVNTISELQNDAIEIRDGSRTTARKGQVPWQHYRRAEALAKVREGHTIFVDYTADWCASCKTNEATSLNIEATRRLMEELKVIPYRADFTNKSAEITEDLDHLGKAGVPVYAIYRAGQPDNPILLPEVLTPGIVANGLRQAGPSKVAARAENEVAQRSPAG